MRHRLHLALWAFTLLASAGCSERLVEPGPAPSRPTTLRATLVSSNSVRLEWMAVGPPDASITYSVYRNDTRIGDVTGVSFVDSALAGNTTYTWFVVTKAADGRTSAPSDPVTMAFADIAPPTVTTASPANNATGISRIPFALVTFSEPMIPLSVTAGGITAAITSTNEPVYGTINYSAATRSADFWPLWVLPARTSITVKVTTEVRDVSGNRLASPYTYTFVTGDNPDPSTLPPSDAPLIASAAAAEGTSRDIYKMRVDGTGRVNLTSNPASDLHASWSPDGRHVAFASDRNGTFDIYIMRDDGTGLRQITFDEKDQTQPRWSPDGKRIFFMSTKEGVAAPSRSTAGDIWSMNPDGSNEVNLTRSPAIYDSWPDPSPDGKLLLFNSAGQFVVANVDGTGVRPLKPADSRFADDAAAWSPDGGQVAYSAFNLNHEMFNENFLLLLVKADGTEVRQLTTSGSQRFPAWSPDGRSLLFSISGFDEFWARFGKIGAGTMDLATRVVTTIAPQFPPTEVMSTQSWRR